jgi:hypothetical protein
VSREAFDTEHFSLRVSTLPGGDTRKSLVLPPFDNKTVEASIQRFELLEIQHKSITLPETTVPHPRHHNSQQEWLVKKQQFPQFTSV